MDKVKALVGADLKCIDASIYRCACVLVVALVAVVVVVLKQ
jgi:hypothetical protein